ncbi:MAG TPA: tetratricopeptide repeat protein [Bacteroidetes bacterium]|nr:tetratricopeptide repeat protein [Bacteroidota bacterium]
MKFPFGFLLFAFLFFPAGLQAQDKALDRADRLFKETYYPQALEIYAKFVKENPRNKRATLRLAECYRLTNDSRNAYRWYARVVKFKGIKPLVWFDYGQVLMVNRKYEAAIPWFEKYQQAVPEDQRAREMIEACLNLKSFASQSRLYAIRKLRINSESSDFGPTFYGNKVVFASSRKRPLAKKYSRNGQSFLDLYVANYAGKAELIDPVLFRGKVNTPYHEATACFSSDGKEMYFTRNNYQKRKLAESKSGVVKLATYKSVLIDGKWQDAKPLPFNNVEYSVGHPCLSPDGKRLFFVSNIPGGMGGTDLYVAEKLGDSWAAPMPLGNTINTQGNEMFPWMDAVGNLYFASDGHAGLGGLDIYKAEWRADAFGPVTNMGAPINSSHDDFGLIYRAADGLGFFTSNRPGGKGDDDIWAYIRLIPLVGFIRDHQGNPIVDATVTVLTGRSALRLGADEEGKFIYGLRIGQKYKIIIDKTGFQKKEVQIDAAGMDRDQNNVRVIELEKIITE